ncbi:MAG: flippase [Oscillospiraceae bacterium]|jgi:O-antigen/teichoic acid export membrane protein
MPKSIVKNYIYNVSYQILLILIPLITTPYVSRVLGSDNVGIFNYTQSVVNYFILFGCIGLNMYGQREIAYCQNNPQKRSRVFWELVLLRLITVSLSLLVYYFGIAAHSPYQEYYLIFLVEIVAAVFDISWFFQGLENFKMVAIRNFIIKLSGVALIFLFVKTKEQLDIYIWCYAATVFLGNLSLWIGLPKLLVKGGFSFSEMLRHLWPALGMFVPQIAISVYTQLDKTMLGLLSTNSQVGYYSQAEKMSKLTLAIVTSLGGVMLSRIANTYEEKNKEKIQSYLANSFRFTFFLAIPIMFGIIGISNDFVPWFFGEGWDEVSVLMNWISPIVVLIGLSSLISKQYLIPTKKVKYYTASVVVGACINVCFNFLLIPSLGAKGASFATLLAEGGVTALQLWFVRREISLSVFRYSVKNFICGGVMLAAIWGVSILLPSTIWATFIEITVGVVVYIGLLLLLRDPFVFSIAKKAALKLKKGRAK